MFLGIGDVIVFLGSVTALILGLIAVRRPSQHLLGGLAIGIAAAQLAGILATWLSNAFFRLF